MTEKKLIGADYLLLLLYLSKRAAIYGAVRLTKMMFLFEKEIAPLLEKKGLGSEKLAEFFSYNFGPFSKELYEQIDLFSGIGFIKVTNKLAKDDTLEVDDWTDGMFVDEAFDDENNYLHEDGKFMVYQITDDGARYVEENILPISKEQKNILEQFKNKIIAITPRQLLKYVYEIYPGYTEKSLIIQEVFG